MTRILVLVFSILAGGGAAWLTMNGEPQVVQPGGIVGPAAAAVEAPASPALEEILVAAVDLEHRRKVAPEDLQWQAWPKEALQAGFITRSAQPEAVEAMVGHTVHVAMLAGEPIRQEKVNALSNGFMSTLLSSGRRAVAVRVSAETTAGGFILPEDRVDVLHTTVPAGSSGGVTQTIVTNVRVLAIDQQVSTSTSDVNSVAAAKTATLELDPAQAEAVSAAGVSGSLSLALRSSADNSEVQIVTREAERTVHIISAGRSQIATTK